MQVSIFLIFWWFIGVFSKKYFAALVSRKISVYSAPAMVGYAAGTNGTLQLLFPAEPPHLIGWHIFNEMLAAEESAGQN